MQTARSGSGMPSFFPAVEPSRSPCQNEESVPGNEQKRRAPPTKRGRTTLAVAFTWWLVREAFVLWIRDPCMSRLPFLGVTLVRFSKLARGTLGRCSGTTEDRHRETFLDVGQGCLHEMEM
ncbi:hypothetical protein TGVAND_288845 [Toxoplasma gondii VAND]|uniref:Uncharacterized protein n=1 Tax=Toxoplasma gondii VAND TaxID=933077 RepID=A0A086Q8A8_TOXGO|nr:hypothetical protein TGVAND_288845 [Toxoplasma gondii VAND]